MIHGTNADHRLEQGTRTAMSRRLFAAAFRDCHDVARLLRRMRPEEQICCCLCAEENQQRKQHRPGNLVEFKSIHKGPLPIMCVGIMS